MPKGREVKIGPWPGGINLIDQADMLEEGQLASCINFDIDNKGILIPRRGLTPVAIKHNGIFSMAGTVTLKGEPSQRASIAAFAAPNTIFAFYRDPNVASDAVTGPTLMGQYSQMVQYLDKLWYIPGVVTSVGKMGSAEVATIATVSDVPAMPWGDIAFILKDRLFIIRKSESTIFYSKVSDFTSWAADATQAASGGLVRVSPGDNQPITKVLSLNNQIIIFKREQTYILSYNASPTADGVLRQVSADQGAIDAITYNNEIYTFNARSVFKFVNGFFSDIGIQLDLPNRDNMDATAGNLAKLTVVGKTLIFGQTPVGNTYALNLDSGAWTQYRFSSPVTFAGSVYSRSTIGLAVFFGEGTTQMYYLLVKREATRTADGFVSGSFTCPEYSFRTKEYTFDDGEAWKRLYSWHLDGRVMGLGEARAKTFVNGAEASSTTDITDLIGSGSYVSTRFRGLALGLATFTRVATSGESVGMVVDGLRAVVGAKSAVSK